MNKLNKHMKRIIVLMVSILSIQSLSYLPSAHAENVTYWYSQKGLTYQGKTLTSMCYIACYAMILKNLGIDTDPVDVYVANGCSNYANHTKIGAAYGVDTSEKGDLSGLTTTKKKEQIRKLLAEHPEGIIVGGCYSGSSYHYVVAIKADDNYIYFDDPAYGTKAEGSCIKLANTWKLTWSNLSMYRIIRKNKNTAVQTTAPVATPKVTIVPTTPAATSSADVINTVEPTATPAPTPNSTNVKDYTVPTRSIYLKNPIMKGEDVKWVQAALYTLGYDITIDGSFGNVSWKTVKTYQKTSKLTVDGCVGSATRKSLISSLGLLETRGNLTKLKKMSSVNGKVTSSNTYSTTISWTAQSSAQGYQVVYADNEDFESKSKKKVTKNSAKLTKLVPNKTYYIKARAYTVVGNVKVYGKYSSVIKVKVSK